MTARDLIASVESPPGRLAVGTGLAGFAGAMLVVAGPLALAYGLILLTGDEPPSADDLPLYQSYLAIGCAGLALSVMLETALYLVLADLSLVRSALICVGSNVVGLLCGAFVTLACLRSGGLDWLTSLAVGGLVLVALAVVLKFGLTARAVTRDSERHPVLSGCLLLVMVVGLILLTCLFALAAGWLGMSISGLATIRACPHPARY